MSRKHKELVKPSNHSGEIPRLRKIIGQLEGTENMIRKERPCVEILQQVRASYAAVKALEVAILKRHLNSCITASAKKESTAAFNNRLSELLDLIKG